MKIYIVLFNIDYEGSDIRGVFETKEFAQKYIEENKNDVDWPGVSFSIKEWRVNESI